MHARIVRGAFVHCYRSPLRSCTDTSALWPYLLPNYGYGCYGISDKCIQAISLASYSFIWRWWFRRRRWRRWEVSSIVYDLPFQTRCCHEGNWICAGFSEQPHKFYCLS
jgi:hypothetical protein